MYAVINVITIIRHQLRCIDQVTFFYFLFILSVHVISTFKAYPVKFGIFLGHIYSLSSCLYKPSVASSQASVPLWCFILGPLVRVCLSVCLSLLSRPEFLSYRVGIHNLGPTLGHLKTVFWVFGWVHFLG